MNKRRSAWVLGVVGATLVAALWWVGSRSLSPLSVAVDRHPTPSPSALQGITPNPATARQEPGGPPEPSDPRWKERELQRQVDPDYEWKTSINFYGRVVDENNQPMEGVKVEFSWTDLTALGNSETATWSNSQGAFSLQGKTGRVLQVDLSKDGYYQPKSERLKSFDYAGFWAANYYEADPVRPILFHLRKKGEGARLSTGELHPSIPPDGTPVRFDLLNGERISAEGQLEIAAVTNTEQYPPRIFDWRATISIPSGGLIEHNSEFPFEAPEHGYVASVAVNMPANAPNWQRIFQKTYYIKFGEPPKYGHVQVRLNGASQKATISYSINPSGSRKLEPALTPEMPPR